MHPLCRVCGQHGCMRNGQTSRPGARQACSRVLAPRAGGLAAPHPGRASAASPALQRREGVRYGAVGFGEDFAFFGDFLAFFFGVPFAFARDFAFAWWWATSFFSTFFTAGAGSGGGGGGGS